MWAVTQTVSSRAKGVFPRTPFRGWGTRRDGLGGEVGAGKAWCWGEPTEGSAENRSHFKEVRDFVCREPRDKPFARMQGSSWE